MFQNKNEKKDNTHTHTQHAIGHAAEGVWKPGETRCNPGQDPVQPVEGQAKTEPDTSWSGLRSVEIVRKNHQPFAIFQTVSPSFIHISLDFNYDLMIPAKSIVGSYGNSTRIQFASYT